MDKDIYDPKFVAGVFDSCAANYRRWSLVASFGFIHHWRKKCVEGLNLGPEFDGQGVDLMAGTGEVWPHILKAWPKTSKITAIDISPKMHEHALKVLHKDRSDKIGHICADALTTDLSKNSADFVISTFGLKTFNEAQHRALAKRIAQILKPGASYSLIEAADPKGWMLRPLYRFYLDQVLPLVEKFFLRGAQDFAMIGTYTRNFARGETMQKALHEVGLTVDTKYYVGGSAVRFSGKKVS